MTHALEVVRDGLITDPGVSEGDVILSLYLFRAIILIGEGMGFERSIEIETNGIAFDYDVRLLTTML